MKLTIEIKDDAFAHAINKEVGRAIAEMAEKAISEQAEIILNKKVERKVEALMPVVFAKAQEAMQKAFIGSIGKTTKKKKAYNKVK